MMRVKALILCLLFWVIQSHATFQEGVDYHVLPNPPSEESRSITVKEVFSFNCPACYLSEPSIRKWKESLSKDVKFERVPVALSKQMVQQSKAFYIAKHFKQEDAFIDAVFLKIHKEGKQITKEQELVALLENLGVEKKQVESAFDSISLNIQVEKDKAYVIEQKLFEIPVLIVADRYKVSPGMTGGDMDKFFAIVNYLLKKIRKS